MEMPLRFPSYNLLVISAHTTSQDSPSAVHWWSTEQLSFYWRPGPGISALYSFILWEIIGSSWLWLCPLLLPFHPPFTVLGWLHDLKTLSYHRCYGFLLADGMLYTTPLGFELCLTCSQKYTKYFQSAPQKSYYLKKQNITHQTVFAHILPWRLLWISLIHTRDTPFPKTS